MKARARVKSNGGPLKTSFLKFQKRRLNDAKKEIKELEQTIVRIKKQTSRARALWKKLEVKDKMIWKTKLKKRGN